MFEGLFESIPVVCSFLVWWFVARYVFGTCCCKLANNCSVHSRDVKIESLLLVFDFGRAGFSKNVGKIKKVEQLHPMDNNVSRLY